ncbi:MAG: serine/threonine protein kinase [Candidatus Riflebacteria bacterium]|nr:serine/threonine protein kinase [Candidatus Riflebacteria bacterium]
MEDQTCELCGRPIPVDPAARTLVKCPACSALLVPAEAVRISLLVRSGDSRPREATAIELPDEFRRRYRLERVLGVGAMGTVFKAVQLSMDRLVAVKVLIRREEPRALDRFLREGQVLAALRHPNLVQVYDLDVLDGCPYLVTEYLDGGTLATRLKTRGRFEPAEAGRIVLECLAALDACHQAGFVHRDLKPENIMFAADARAKIVDFGMATILSSPRDLTQAGSVIGTPRYMAPEQILGKAVDARTDLYALGTILFEMIAGRPPFTASSVREVFQMHLFKPPPGLSELVHGVPDRLVELVERSLAKEPDQRPASAEAFGEELRRALGETVQDPRTARGPGDPGEQAVKRPAALKTPRVPRAPRAPGEGSSAARAPRPGRGLALGALLGLVAAVAATVQLARTDPGRRSGRSSGPLVRPPGQGGTSADGPAPG